MTLQGLHDFLTAKSPLKQGKVVRKFEPTGGQLAAIVRQ
jgi:hypothetical protein